MPISEYDCCNIATPWNVFKTSYLKIVTIIYTLVFIYKNKMGAPNCSRHGYSNSLIRIYMPLIQNWCLYRSKCYINHCFIHNILKGHHMHKNHGHSHWVREIMYLYHVHICWPPYWHWPCAWTGINFSPHAGTGTPTSPHWHSAVKGCT